MYLDRSDGKDLGPTNRIRRRWRSYEFFFSRVVHTTDPLVFRLGNDHRPKITFVYYRCGQFCVENRTFPPACRIDHLVFLLLLLFFTFFFFVFSKATLRSNHRVSGYTLAIYKHNTSVQPAISTAVIIVWFRFRKRSMEKSTESSPRFFSLYFFFPRCVAYA